MKMKSLLAATLLLTAGSLTHAAEAGMPQLAEPYQKSFQAAWEQVNAGELPVYECMHVVGVAAKQVGDPATAESARQAFRACYVDAILRYSDTYFKLRHNAEISDDGKPYGCNMYDRYLKGHVVSMESQVEKLGYNVSALNRDVLDTLNESAKLCQVELD